MNIPTIFLDNHKWDSFGLDQEEIIEHLTKLTSMFEIFTPSNLDNIPKNKPYVVFVNVYGNIIHDSYEYSLYNWSLFNKATLAHDVFAMPERVWNDSSDGLVTWIIHHTTEADINEHLNLEKMIQGFNLQNHRKNLIFLTGAETPIDPINNNIHYLTKKHGIQIYSWNRIFQFTPWHQLGYQTYINFLESKIKDILAGLDAPFKSVMYGRVPRSHRVFSCAYLKKHKLKDKVIYSLGGTDVGKKNGWMYKEYFPEYTNEIIYYETFKESINCVLLEEGIDLKVNQAHTVSYEHASKSYFNIISETNNCPSTFLTEKTMKAMWMAQPFVMLGPQYNILALKRRGFKTFDKWINHSYDSIEDTPVRIKSALDESARLMSISNKQWNNMLIEMLPDILHNIMFSEKEQDSSAITSLIEHLIDFTKTSF